MAGGSLLSSRRWLCVEHNIPRNRHGWHFGAGVMKRGGYICISVWSAEQSTTQILRPVKVPGLVSFQSRKKIIIFYFFLKKKKKKTHDIRSRNSKNALAATKAWIDTAGQYSHIPGNFRVSEA